MPTFRPATPPKPIEIKDFKGLNESLAETEIDLGEAVKQVNFRLTQELKPIKRFGHNTFIDFGNSLPVHGGWYGTINEKEVLITINDEVVYEYDMTAVTEATAIADLITEGVVVELGPISDSRTKIFRFNDYILFINGIDFKYYDGSNYGNVKDIAYIPTIAIETPPDGGGVDFEEVNNIQPKKFQEFTGDGAKSDYYIRETDLDSDLTTVTINGSPVAELVGYTVDRAIGKFDFLTGSVPYGVPALDDLVITGWTKENSEAEGLITGNRFAMDFGPGNDTAVFMWGHEDFKNKRIWSGPNDPTYWPETNFTLIGSDEFAITDITAQYDRQIIHKFNRTHYSLPEFVSLINKYDYPVFDLNESVGNSAFDSVRLVENSPVSLHGQSWWLWTNTQVEDERNAKNISERIRKSLQDLDLTTAITFDYQKEKELWVNVEDNVYIWNYGNDTFYIYDNIDARWFLDISNIPYYGSNGTVERFDGLSDNEDAIEAIMELGFTDFGVNQLTKNSRVMWVTIQPYSRTSLEVSYATNRFNTGEAKSVKPVEYKLFDYGDIDYGEWSYATNRNPQPFQRKIRAKKYAYIKFIFRNIEPDENVALVSIKVIAETQGFVK